VPFVGLTGGMGAGKSTALAALARLGAEVISADAIVHQLYQGDELRDILVARWGDEIAPAGAIERSAVARKVFADAAEREWLEGVLWPLVRARVASWLDETRARVPRPKAAVVEAPLLFEAGMDGIYDATIAVIADDRLRAERVAERGHALAEERDVRQLSQEQKAQRATFSVRNDGSVHDLERKLSDILDKLKA
jgi:dephospho-CoA kinase